MAISLPLGAGNTGTNDWSDVYNNDAQLVTELDDRDGNYQTLFFVNADTATISTAGSPYLPLTFPSTGTTFVASGGPGTADAPLFTYFDNDDYAIGSKTQKIRVRMQVMVGSTSPSTTVITGGLYPVSVAAGKVTLGTVVSGTTVASSGLTTNTISSFVGSDATVPSDGAYTLGVAVTTAGVPAGINVAMQLQTRWV